MLQNPCLLAPTQPGWTGPLALRLLPLLHGAMRLVRAPERSGPPAAGPDARGGGEPGRPEGGRGSGGAAAATATATATAALEGAAGGLSQPGTRVRRDPSMHREQ